MFIFFAFLNTFYIVNFIQKKIISPAINNCNDMVTATHQPMLTFRREGYKKFAWYHLMKISMRKQSNNVYLSYKY